MSRTIPAVLLAVTMVFAGGTASNAQSANDRTAHEVVAELLNMSKTQRAAAAKRLNMTETQRAAVRPIIEAGILERVQILKDAGFKRGQRPSLRQMIKVRGPIRLSRARTEAKLSAVLDHQQLATYRLLVEEWCQKVRDKHFGDL